MFIITKNIQSNYNLLKHVLIVFFILIKFIYLKCSDTFPHLKFVATLFLRLMNSYEIIIIFLHLVDYFRLKQS